MLNNRATSRVLQVGVGGVGAPIAQHLGLIADRLVLVDGDEYEDHNVIRQPFAMNAMGRPKSDVVAERLEGSKAKVESIPEFITEENIEHLLKDTKPTLVVLCVDNDEARKLIFDRSDRFPILWGANELWDPQAGLSTPKWRWNPMEFFPASDVEPDADAAPGCGEQTISANLAAANLASALLHSHLAPQEQSNAKEGRVPIFIAKVPSGIYQLTPKEIIIPEKK